MVQQHITSATKLDKLLSTQYPQYWQYSQYSRGTAVPFGGDNKALSAATIPHNSFSNPNLTTLAAPAPRNISISTSSSNIHLNATRGGSSHSDPNLPSLEVSPGPVEIPPLTLSASHSTANLSAPSSGMTSRGSGGNLYGLGQIQTSTSTTNINALANFVCPCYVDSIIY